MRAMLKVVGIESYLLPIYSGDPHYVREEWASPQQFNHCIIAIRINPETRTPTAIEHPTLGKLMIFDPTDDDTPVGDLPHHEQGSFALLVAGDQGQLLRMPVTSADANRQERTSEASINPDGAHAATSAASPVPIMPRSSKAGSHATPAEPSSHASTRRTTTKPTASA